MCWERTALRIRDMGRGHCFEKTPGFDTGVAVKVLVDMCEQGGVELCGYMLGGWKSQDLVIREGGADQLSLLAIMEGRVGYMELRKWK